MKLNLDKVDSSTTQIISEIALLTADLLTILEPFEAYPDNVTLAFDDVTSSQNIGEQSTTTFTTKVACSCSLCNPLSSTVHGKSSYDLENYITSVVSTLVTPQAATVAPSGDYQINALLGGSSWGNSTTITYSFLTSGAASSYYGTETVSQLTTAVTSNIRTIIETLIEPLINVNFVEVADNASSYGQIRYMFSSGPRYAYAYYPSTSNIAGDVHLSPNYEFDSTNRFSGDAGIHGYTTLIHETFHALGLKHPGDYNGSGNGEPPFLPYGEDNLTNTVMTYNFSGASPATAMPYDIKALQYLYGARAYNAENTTYSFSSTYGYTANSQSLGSSTTPTKLTVWDSSGTDTLDFSNLSFDAEGYQFDLREGGFNTSQSNYSATSYTALGDTSGSLYLTSTYGTAIAYNTVIENAIGSSSNDTIIGNTANNTLNGGDGSDTLTGGLGNDIYIVNDAFDLVIENVGEGTDTYHSSASSFRMHTNVENLVMLAGAISATGTSLANNIMGNSANNTLDGGGGNDTLTGGSGTDTLVGGAGDDTLTGGSSSDKLTGGTGKDRFVFNSKEGRDTITDFSVLDDAIYISKASFGGGLTAGTMITATQFKLGSAAGDSSDRFIYNKSTGGLFFDVDGTGVTGQLQFAKLSTGLAMTSNDIFVV